MSLADQSQQWYPTSVQVTVLQARNLRIKGKNGTNDAYAIMQVAKEKFATSVAEKTVSPMWKEEATFELPLFQHGDTERCTLHVSVMHRALVGPDKLLGQAAVNLLELSAMQSRSKTEWLKLLDKAGKPDKDRGEVLVNIQFLRNNMTASMFDLSTPDKQRSRLGKLKDKVRGKKKEGLSDSASAVVPTFTQVLTDSEGEGEPEGDGAADKQEKKKKPKLKSLFSPKSNLQRNVSQSMSVLVPLPERNASLSGSRSSGLNIDSSEGKKKFKFLTHKRTGSSDSKGSQGLASILGRSRQASASSAEQSNLCINGSHVYTEEPQARSSRAGSTFSLASSGRGSMEDLRRSQGRKSSVASVDSQKAGKQPFSWEEESTGDGEEHEEEEEGVELEGGSIRVEQAPEKKLLDVEQSAMEEEKKRAREVQEEESVSRIEPERRRLKEEEQMKEERESAEEKERIRREKEEEMRIEEQERKRVDEDNRRIEEEDRIRREEGDQRKVMEDAEKIRVEEEEKRLAEERENTLMEEEERRVRQEYEEEKVRQQVQLLEEERKEEEEDKEQIREEEEWRKTEEERRRKEEEDRLKREEEEHRLKVEEEERKRLEEEERVRKEVEECRLKEEEERKIREMEKKRCEEEERRKIEEIRREEEDRLKREEDHRLKVEEEERKRLDLEEKMRKEDELRKEEEERRRLEEEERVRKEVEECRLKEEERKIKEVEEKRQEQEERRKIEEIRREEEDRLKREEEHRLKVEEEERKRLEEEERVRKEVEECRLKEEEERKIREMEEKILEEERRKIEEMRRKEEEERKIREVEEKRKREEDEKRQIEERRREEEEDKLKREEEQHRLKVEEEERRRLEEEERVRKEVEECRLKEEEERKIRQMEEKRLEEERRKIEEMRRKEEEHRLKEEEERQKLEEESRKAQEEKSRAEDLKMKAMEEKERARLEEERRKEADLEKEMRRREEEEQERQEQEKMRLTVAEKQMVLQDGGVEALVGQNPFEEPPSEDSFEDFPSTNPFEENSRARSTESLNRTTKISAVKPSSSSCLNPPRVLASPPNPFLSPSELEAPTAPPVGHQGIKTSRDSSASQMEKKRPAPRPPNSLSVPRSSNVTLANPTKPTLRSHSAAELGGKTDARQSKDGVCLDRCGALQDKRPAPQPPNSLRGKPDNQSRTQEDLRRTKEILSKNDKPGEAKESSFSRASLRAVQMIAPLKASTTATREESRGLQGQGFSSHTNQHIDVSDIPSVTGSFRVVKKGPAPLKPDSSSLHDKTVAEYDGNTTNVPKLSVGNYPSNRSPVVFEINSVAESGKATQSRKICDEREGLKAHDQTGSINEEVTLRKSSKVSRAPLPPAKMKAISAVTLETPQNSEAPGSGKAVNKQTNMMEQPVNIMTQTQCFSDPAILDGSPGKTPEPHQQGVLGQGILPQARSQACEARCSEPSSQGGEEVGGKRGQPASTSRRPHPVKPLSSSEQQPLSTIQGVPPEKSEAISGGIKEQIKVQEPAVPGPYSQLTQEELISLVVKQQKQLADKDKKIAELELYIDNLLVRVIEEAPCILMSLNSPKR